MDSSQVHLINIELETNINFLTLAVTVLNHFHLCKINLSWVYCCLSDWEGWRPSGYIAWKQLGSQWSAHRSPMSQFRNSIPSYCRCRSFIIYLSQCGGLIYSKGFGWKKYIRRGAFLAKLFLELRSLKFILPILNKKGVCKYQ